MKKIDLRSNIEVQGRLIQKQKQGLLRKGACEDDALLFAPGKLVHPAVAEMIGPDLRESIAGDDQIVFGFEAQRAAVGVPPLQDKFPRSGGKQKATFLLHHGDALSTHARCERVRDESIQKNAAGERLESAGDQFQESGFTAGVWTQNGNDFSGPRLEAGCFQREQRRLRGIGGVRVANLLDAQTNIGIALACLSWRASCRRRRQATWAAHAIL